MKSEKINFLETLNENHNRFINQLEGTEKVHDKIHSLISELTFYESFIPSFFSKYDGGEGDGIRLIYETMRNEMPRTMFETVDLDFALSKYMEYMEGMEEYITKIAIKNGTGLATESVSEILDNIKFVKERDSQYIDSIFGGKNNEKKEEPYSEAVKELEFLIDFIPKLSEFKEKCSSIQQVFESSNPENGINSSILTLYLESVSNFCHNNIREIISTYYDILESVSTKSSPKKKDEFVLF